MGFLIDHGFQVDLPFRLGVPYLSRHEETEARQNAQHREDGLGFVDVDLKKEDVESLNFMRRTRKEIKAWVARTGVCRPLVYLAGALLKSVPCSPSRIT